MTRRILATTALSLVLACLSAHAATPVAPAQKWVATWAQAMTSNAAAGTQTSAPQPVSQADFTLRQTVLTSVGGGRVRIRLSNYFGKAPLTVAAARIALGVAGSSDLTRIVPSSSRVLRFHGRAGVVIPPGQGASSDAVVLDVPARSTLVISLYFATATQLADMHVMEHMAGMAAVAGDAVDATTLARRARLHLRGSDAEAHIYELDGVDVTVPAATRGVAVFGDSITDGAYASTPAHTWPGVIAALANAPGSGTPMAVVNMGISSDELSTDQLGQPSAGMSGLKRFERDVIDQPGVTDVLVLMGSNDINRGIDRAGQPDGALAGDLIASLRMLIDVAHQHGLRIYVGTIPPFAGFTEAGWFTPEKEAVRQQVNWWIGHAAKVDGVLPFAEVLAGPYWPSPLAAAQHPLPPGLANACAGDTGLHPNDRGYRVMGTTAFDVMLGRKLSLKQRCE
ncbi:GDSL-type esterase/lipase family protein [Rhodanobacter sp. 115]|uniref:GDSL-type esterase/lipase family protein n=1 Tax=Rhodanobacter sp. FW021-MT20 TaxID=1162282 RepID=UPI0034E5FE93